MPNIKSAKKKVLVIERRKQENRYVKSTIATMIKNFKTIVKEDTNKAEKMLNEITSYIDSAETKGVIHKNNASRKIARLNVLLNKAKADKKVEAPAQNVTEEVKAEEVIEKKVAKKATSSTKTATKKTTTKKATKKVEE